MTQDTTPYPLYLSASVGNAPMNLRLRKYLPPDRFELVLPQEFTPEVAHTTLERGIFERCIFEMERSVAGILVLDAFAIDCAMESGWYHSQKKPLVAVATSTCRFFSNWMVKGAITHFATISPEIHEMAISDPIMKGHTNFNFLERWEDLPKVVEAAIEWGRKSK